MNGVDIAVLVIVCAAVAGVAALMIYRKIKGKKTGCGCGCDGCTLCERGKRDK